MVLMPSSDATVHAWTVETRAVQESPKGALFQEGLASHW